MEKKSLFELPVLDAFRRIGEQSWAMFPRGPTWSALSWPAWSGTPQAEEAPPPEETNSTVTVAEVAKALTKDFAPMSDVERLDQDFHRAAQVLLEQHGLATYSSTKLKNLVVEMLFRTAKRQIAGTFSEEKKALRAIVVTSAKQQRARSSVNKNAGQLPSPVTFNKIVNSLEPIYQELRDSLRSELARIRK